MITPKEGYMIDPNNPNGVVKIPDPATVRYEESIAKGGAQPGAKVENQGKAGYDVFGNPVAGYTPPGSPITRYTEGAGGAFGAGGAYDSSVKPFTAEEEAKVREQERVRVQAQIDTVNELLNAELSKLKVSGENKLGKGRAISAATGTLGSPIGDKVETDISNQNREIESATRAQASERINTILSGVESRASELINQRKTTATTNADKYISFLKDTATQAKNDMTALATAGAELSPSQRQALMEQTGYDSDTFDQLYKSLKIANSSEYINKSKPEIIGNKAIFFKQTTDPKTGAVSLTQETLDLPIDPNTDPANIDVVSRDDGIYILNKSDGTYKKIGQSQANLINANNKDDGIGGDVPTTLKDFPEDIQQAAQSIYDGKSKLTEYPSAKRLQINSAANLLYNAVGGNQLAQGAYDAIETLETHPGFSGAVGAKGISSIFGLKEKPIAGSDAAGFLKMLDTLKANIKLVNIKYLRGTGALSDAEGRTLEDAGTSLDPVVGEEDFKKELARVKAALVKANKIDTGASAGTGGSISVTDPNGGIHNFPDQASADAFKKAANIK